MVRGFPWFLGFWKCIMCYYNSKGLKNTRYKYFPPPGFEQGPLKTSHVIWSWKAPSSKPGVGMDLCFVISMEGFFASSNYTKFKTSTSWSNNTLSNSCTFLFLAQCVNYQVKNAFSVRQYSKDRNRWDSACTCCNVIHITTC